MSFSTFRDVIGLWRTPDALASSIGAGVSAARKWWQRDTIPAEWWSPILETPVAQEAGLTAEILAALARRPPARSSDLVEGRV